jgi:hypothetical protein
MLTTDQLLIKFTNSTTPTIEELIPARDARVLRSMASAVLSPKFITENQSKLLVKILKEHNDKLLVIADNLSEVLETNTWSKIFRVIDKVKKFYISSADGVECLDIEFTFNSAVRKAITSKSAEITNIVQLFNGKLYRAELTEKNIVILTDILTKFQFDIDSKIKEYYDTIVSWNKDDIVNKYKITTITNTNFQNYITQDLGINTSIDQNIISDRSHRYQYFIERKEEVSNLTELIANRPQPKIWIDRGTYSLTDLFESLLNLKRLPVLLVFDAWDSSKCVEELKLLTSSLKDNNITTKVGIYFRLANDAVGKEFNQIISTNLYNCELDNTTQVVGIQSGKIPKFLITSKWQPMSIVAIGNSLKQSKTAVFSNNSDLVIQYSDSKPIFEPRILWE